jgi:hypothetical protein
LGGKGKESVREVIRVKLECIAVSLLYIQSLTTKLHNTTHTTTQRRTAGHNLA